MPFFLPSELDLFEDDDRAPEVAADHGFDEVVASGEDGVALPGTAVEFDAAPEPAVHAEELETAAPEVVDPELAQQEIAESLLLPLELDEPAGHDAPLSEPVAIADEALLFEAAEPDADPAAPEEDTTAREAAFVLAGMPGVEPDQHHFELQVFSPTAEAPIDLEPGIADEFIAEPEIGALMEDGVPPPAETVENFEDSLTGELAKLRLAIAALDHAFKRPAAAAAPQAEPSFADLVSDTVQRMAR